MATGPLRQKEHVANGVRNAALVVALAVSVGALTVWQPAVPAAAVIALLLGVALWWACSGDNSGHIADKRFWWVGVAWAFILLHPIGRYSQRSSLAAAQGSASIEDIVEIAGHVVIALLAVTSLRRNRLGAVLPLPVIALPALALASTAWSVTRLLTLGLALEMQAFVFLAILTAAIMRKDPEVGRQVLGRTFRVIVFLTAVYALVGLAVGDAGTLGPLPPGEPNRFTWPGAQAITASAVLGFAFLIVLFGGRRPMKLSLFMRVFLLGLFAVCLYLGQTRTALIATAVGVIAGYLVTTRGRTLLARLAGHIGVAATIVAAGTLYGATIYQYLLRGETQQQVFGFNGRLGLWELALQQVHSLERWIWGYGLGGSRIMVSSDVSWAAGAHSAWLELLLSFGFVGVIIGISLVAAVAIRLVGHVGHRGAHGPVLVAAFVYVLTMSPTVAVWGAPGPGPGLGFGVLAFCYVVCSVRLHVRQPEMAGATGVLRRRPLPART